MPFTKDFFVGSHRDIVDNFISVALPKLNIDNVNTYGDVVSFDDWEQLDDRYATDFTFFGHTYEVPVSKFDKKEGSCMLVTDTWMCTQNAYVKVGNRFKYDEEFSGSSLDVGGSFLYTHYGHKLANTLSSIFKGGHVSVRHHTINTLDAVISDIKYFNNLPSGKRYLIFNGVEGSLSLGDTVDSVISKLQYIGRLCHAYGIRCLCVFTPTLDMCKIISDYLSIINRQFKYIDTLNVLSVMYCDYNVASLDDVSNFIKGMIKDNYYYIIVYNNIKYQITYKFLSAYRDRYYLSLVYVNINSMSYGKLNKLIGTYDPTLDASDPNKKSRYIYPDTYFNKYCTDYLHLNDQFISSKYTDSSAYLDLFKNKGEFVALCVHTEYNRKLFACEQKQANCSDEWKKTRESYGVSALLNLLKFRRIERGRSEDRLSPACYPMTGCPWLTISNEDKQLFVNGIGVFKEKVYLTRNDNNSVSITVGVHSNTGMPDCYQSVSCGVLKKEKTNNYLLPLFVAGGTQGISCDVYSFYPSSGGTRTYISGNVYDLSIQNICGANSNLLHVTRFNNSYSSPFKFLSPEGLWKNVFVHAQSSSVVNYPSLGPTPDHAIKLGDITDIGDSYTTIYPHVPPNCKAIGSKYIDMLGMSNTTGKDDTLEYRYSSYMPEIRIVSSTADNHNEGVIYGCLPNQYAFWDFELPCGVVIVGGKRYLSVPNGWINRLKHYNFPNFSIINDIWDTESVVDNWEKNHTELYGNIMYKDRLLILLG